MNSVSKETYMYEKRQCVIRDLSMWKRTRKRNLCVRKETCKRVQKMQSVSKETHMSVERDPYQRPLENTYVCDAHTGGKDWSDPIENSIFTANPNWGDPNRKCHLGWNKVHFKDVQNV